MYKYTLLRRATGIWIFSALLCLAVTGAAAAQTPAQFTVDRTVKFTIGTEKERVQWRKIPAAREIVESEFAYAKEDLNGDGRPELILLSRSPSLCRDGGCALLVLQKPVQGIDILLAAKVPGALALTREPVDGYRALALLDTAGQIAIGNRIGSPLFGKQVVYPMRYHQTQAQAGSSPAETTPAKGPSSAGVESAASIEMVELIKMFMTPQQDPDALGDWAFGAQSGSPIRWETTGIKETSPEEQKAGYPYFRAGKVILTVDGKLTHQVLEKSIRPGKWAITLSGPRGGFTRATISAPNSQELGASILDVVKGELPLRHYRCKTPSVSSGNKVYQVQGAGKKPFWINEEWSCGSAGCGLTLELVFTKKEADRFECF